VIIAISSVCGNMFVIMIISEGGSEMREIKFRAWIKKDEYMAYPKSSDHDYCMICNGDGFGVAWSDEDWLKQDDFEIMQYTGLKDKNGTDIYEGDVVNFEYEYPGTVNGEPREVRKRLGKIVWQKFRATWAIKLSAYANNDLYKYVQGYGVEVIGNIYENPELLESEDGE
jgi:uncharacterized phage protein (TIGR01671 family)